MITQFALEMIEGVLKRTETRTYRNGMKTKRIISKDGVTPEDCIILDTTRKDNQPAPPIMHREDELYRFYFGV